MTRSSVVLHLHEGLPGLVLTSLLTGMSRLFRRHSPLLTAVCYSIKAQVSLRGLCTSPSFFFFNLLFFQRWLCFSMVMCFCVGQGLKITRAGLLLPVKSRMTKSKSFLLPPPEG